MNMKINNGRILISKLIIAIMYIVDDICLSLKKTIPFNSLAQRSILKDKK